MTVYDAELQALYQPTAHECHALLFFNPAGDYDTLPLETRDGWPEYHSWPEYARRGRALDDVDGPEDMERLIAWNPYVVMEDAPCGSRRWCVIATADCSHFPDAPCDEGHPTRWLWANPDADPENLTVRQSIGWMQRDGEWLYHFFVEDGGVRNV